jgi:hypothetical protein
VTTDSAACGSGDGVDGVSEAIKHSDRLPRCGNGWPGSMASGVTMGRTVRWKCSSRNVSCAGVSSAGLSTTDSLGGQHRLELIEEAPVLLVAQAARPLRDRGQGLGRGEAVRAGRPSPARCALEPGYADHEELVEVRADDREEFHPLEERHRRIFGLLEDPAIELEP